MTPMWLDSIFLENSEYDVTRILVGGADFYGNLHNHPMTLLRIFLTEIMLQRCLKQWGSKSFCHARPNQVASVLLH